MSNVLVRENIFLGLESMSKEEAIKLAGQKLVDGGYVEPAYIDAMLEREKVMSTYMGMGVAIPHGVNEAKKEIKESGIVILQFPNGVSFDGEKAFILFGIAGKGDEHLEILSNIAVALDEDLTEKLKNTNDKEEFMSRFA